MKGTVIVQPVFRIRKYFFFSVSYTLYISESRIRILEATLIQIRPDPDHNWPFMRPPKNILANTGRYWQ
jgi:hypothetical protein